MSRLYAVGALTLSAALLATHSTEAQQIYLIHDLGQVANNAVAGRIVQFSGTHTVRLPFRINNKNQVVFYTRDASGNYTAKLWLPEDDSSIGLDRGVYELTVEDGSDEDGIALDINESTQFAGGRDDNGTEKAIVWTISGGTVTGTLIDFTGTDFSGSNSRAHGIQDGDRRVIARFGVLSDTSRKN